MTRFFVRTEQIQGSIVILDADDAHHLHVVLQAKPGDRLTVLDGSGRAWPAVLLALGKNRAEARLGEAFEPHTEPDLQITVAQALPKMAEKMEQVLQRGTEIGVTEFWAYASERSMTHLTAERHDKRMKRWQVIVKTAAEQAFRAKQPTLRADGALADVLAAASAYDLALMAHPGDAQTTLRDVLSGSSLIEGSGKILIIIGPEAGFSETEITQAQRAGVKTVTLGPRILRTETAALVMAAQILFAGESSTVR
jgi:16S rRNA (uracil1498-N3)-methyltransferase